jgi:hypothetical protein
VDTFRAQDLTDDHLGQYLHVDGVGGVLHAYRHLDDTLVQIVLDRPPWFASLPAGRPIEVTPPVQCSPV